MDLMKSDFGAVVPDDSKQYYSLVQRFLKLNPENLEEAFELMKEAFAAACRWSEIQASAKKVCAIHTDITTTAFKEWSYAHYRQLQEMHITCRGIYREASEYRLWERKSQN